MENQKKNTGLYVLIAILGVLVLLMGGYIVYDKTQNNNDTPTNTPNNNPANPSETNPDNTGLNNNTDAFVSKLDDTKDWIYDAEYKKNVKVESYSSSGYKYYAKDIVVPYINVDSEYAKKANKDIKKVFDKAISIYNEGIKDDTTWLEECKYKKAIINDNLSVSLTYHVGAPAKTQPEYYTYNINLKTGKQLSYEEIYTIAGFNSTNIDSKVENAINNWMDEELNYLLEDPDEYEDAEDISTYKKESMNNYKKSITDNTLQYFLNENGKLNIAVRLNVPFESGECIEVFTIE